MGSKCGNDRPHAGPGLRPTLDLEAPAQLVGALAHRVQAEMPRIGTLRVESDSIVRDLEPDVGVLLAQTNPNARGARVAAGVVQRLLGNSIQRLLALPAHRGFSGEGLLDGDAVPGTEHGGVVLERARQA